MSAQINLYHARFQRQREWLSLVNAVGAVVIALFVTGVGVGWATAAAKQDEEQAAAAEVEAKVARDQVASAQVLLTRPPDAALLRTIDDLDLRLARRVRTTQLLQAALPDDRNGFSTVLRGFARHTPTGVWLTGVTMAGDGVTMEIRGRMTDGAKLPVYIGLLGADRAFAGRHFAALDMNRPKLEVPAGQPAETSAKSSSPERAAYIEFVLRPVGAPTAAPAAERKS